MENEKYFENVLNKADSALHLAIIKKDWELLKAALRDPDTNPNAKNTKGETPLMLTLSYPSKIQAFAFAVNLLEAGADVNLFSNDEAPIHKVAGLNLTHMDDMKLFYLIIRQPNIKIMVGTKKEGQTPLHLATCIKAFEIFKSRGFKYSGFDVNVKNLLNETPLHVNTNNYEICKYLINNGAQIDLKDNYGHTPLAYAFIYRKKDTMELLLENGAKVKDARVGFKDIFQVSYIQNAEAEFKDLLWKYTDPAYWIVAAPHDETAITRMLKDWHEYIKNNVKRFVELFLRMLSVINSQPNESDYNCFGCVLMDFFENEVDHLQKMDIMLCSQFFRHILNENFLNFILKNKREKRAIYKLTKILIDCDVDIDYDDIDRLYKLFGDSKLLKEILIHREVISKDIKRLHQIALFPQYIRNVNETDLQYAILFGDITTIARGIYDLTRYFMLPPCVFRQHLGHFIRIFCSSEIQDQLARLKQPLPSLVELSRNAFRGHAIQEFHFSNPKQLWDLLTKMQVPKHIKEIICLEQPLYPMDSTEGQLLLKAVMKCME